jgi:hypothetical protein
MLLDNEYSTHCFPMTLAKSIAVRLVHIPSFLLPFFSAKKGQLLSHSLAIPWSNISHFAQRSLMNLLFGWLDLSNGADSLLDFGHFEGNFSNNLLQTSR